MGVAGRLSILGLAVAAYLMSSTITGPPQSPQPHDQGSGLLASSELASVQAVEPLVASWADVFTPDGRAAKSCAGNPNALGLARTVEVDTTGGPGLGFEQYKAHDFLLLKEVVLTFDDGPWPTNTRAVLDALAHHCVKATFFPIGKHALWHPEILKQVAAAGHTVGAHTWSHANLAKLTADKAHEEIEKGFSAVKLALAASPAPFFRFPYLQDTKAQLSYLASRNIAIVSHDVDSFDFRMRKPEDVVKSVMTKLDRKGKGIILLHDFQQATARAVSDLLNELKAKDYKVVHMKAKASLSTLAQWDDAAKSEVKGAGVGADRPTSTIVRTIVDNSVQSTAARIKGYSKK
jgi:peptidoglycan/xylan/chitin deacetylase (PgdA/CDA1 family)